LATRAESATVNAAGLVQGIALVTFPAASAIFTARSSYDLSSSQYGAMLSLVVAHGRPSPATVHPRPAQPRPRLSPAAGTGEAPAQYPS